MNESGLQRVFKYKIHPRDSIITTNKGFVNIDNGSQGGTHWCAFYVKNNKFSTLTHSVVSQINFNLNNYLIQ